MNAVYIEKIKEKLEIKKLPAENAGSNSEQIVIKDCS